MKLYFGNAITTATTLMILALLGFIGWSVVNRSGIQYWGRRNTVLLVFGLVVCCFAATRDGLDKTIQHAIATPIARTQKVREAWFYVMSSGAVLKIATMEIARIMFR